jgi:hypothetical protein
VPDEISVSRIIETIKMYRLGTVKAGYFKGALTIPFIDSMDRIHAIQVKCFDKTNHTTKTTFFHSILKAHYDKQWKKPPEWLTRYLKNESKVDCLFGEHLLKELPNNPVAIVEAPKTAFYCNINFGSPYSNQENYLWLSSFNISSLNFKRLKAIEGRKVTLFPDASPNSSALNLWEKNALKALEKLNNTKISVDTWLEKAATESERNMGCDLADLIHASWEEEYYNKQKGAV